MKQAKVQQVKVLQKKKGMTVAITTKDMQKRRNDVKARTTLLLALPDEYQLRFSKYETAKELWEAILKTFVGNEATKMKKKNQLKLQYGNFKAEGSYCHCNGLKPKGNQAQPNTKGPTGLNTPLEYKYPSPHMENGVGSSFASLCVCENFNNMQTQTSNTLHNAIMEAGSKDRPPMLTPGWKEKFVLDSEGNPTTTTEKVFETYKTVTQDIRDQLNAEAETVQIILTGIDNDIYSIVDACPNACEMWKAIERLKQGESINVQDLKTNLFWEFGKFTSQDGKSLESYYSRFYKMMNELTRNQ
nr:Gag-Pol polyprotein [Tanacetum cinerariifolium]